MHNTSSLYQTIKSGVHTERVILEIETVTNGTTEYVELDESSLYSLKVSGSVFPEDKPSIGNFCAREIDAVFETPNKTIPKQARMRVFTYVANATQQSERIPKGVYWIDTREYNADKTKMIVHGYDSAVKFDSDIDDTNIEWPTTNPANLLIAICGSVGVGVDASVVEILNRFVTGYNIPLLICTKREMVAYIAAKCGCNAYIDDKGRLHFMYLRIDPNDITNGYLIDENSNYITIGGDRIIVERNY